MAKSKPTKQYFSPFLMPGGETVAAAGFVDLAAAVVMVSEYWTKERLANAEPIPMPVVHPSFLPTATHAAGGLGQVIAAALSGSPTVPLFVPPVAPSGGPAIAAAGEEGNSSVDQVADMAAYPYGAVGKLFMTSNNGRDMQGSAWVIGNRAIITAGHCVKYNAAGGAFSNVIFQPQFSNGQSPATYVLSKTTATPQWVSGEDLVYDIGVGITSQPMTSAWQVGFPTGAYDPKSLSPFLSVGYPVASDAYPSPAGFDFDGNTMFQCTGGFEATVPNSKGFGFYCRFTPGSSGGPVFTRFQGKYVVCGLNSWINQNENPVTKMHSPYLGDEFLKLVQWARDNGGDIRS